MTGIDKDNVITKGIKSLLSPKTRNFIRSIIFTLNSYNKNNGIYVYNWWENIDESFWFSRFIKHRLGITKQYNFFSCFARKLLFIKYYKGVNIFYTQENLQVDLVKDRVREYGDHRLNEVNLALGFEFRKEVNYYRFPQWIIYNDFISPKSSLNDIKNKINDINKPENRLKNNSIEDKKQYFTVLISSHDISGHRQRLKDIADKIAPVTCAGKFANNTNDLYEKYDNNKLEYMRNFRFNICPENSIGVRLYN